MKALIYELQTEAPLLLTRLEGDPNSAVSYPYVPGSAIRGALINRYSPGGIANLAEDDDARRLFFSNDIRYLNAYPLDRMGQRTLPTPFCWAHEKQEPLEYGASVYDFSVEDYALEEPKGIDKPFCWLDGDKVELYEPDVHVSVHTARERTKGRATENEGAIFRYEALAVGARLGGVILVDEEQDFTTLKNLLTGGDLWLGGSRSGGYGRVQVVVNATTQDNWLETPAIENDLLPGDRLVITLLSDAILRMADGAFVDVLLPEQLLETIRSAINKGPSTIFKRISAVGGFNRRWGLPLDQTPAIMAGSVFVYDISEVTLAEDLQDLQAEGIGERRSEGFGRIAINWHAEQPELTIRKFKIEPERGNKVALLGESKKLAMYMVERWLRRDLDGLLAAYIEKLGSELKNSPNRAQLSRLRSVTLNALPSCDVWRLLEFLFDSNLKTTARDQYLRARLKGVRLLDWLVIQLLNVIPEEEANKLHEKLKHGNKEDPDVKRYGKVYINGELFKIWLEKTLEKREPVWNLLSPDPIHLPKLGDVKAELTDKLAKEYTIRLIAGLLHRAAKESKS